MIRIRKCEIKSVIIWNDILSILKENLKLSVALESGVISIYPMLYQKENPTEN